MQLPTARDLMTPDVVTVPPETPFFTVAQMLAQRHISAVPVVGSAGEVLGIVTEADLIRRLAGDAKAPMGLLRSLFSNMDRLADRYASTHGTTAAEIMTPDAITVSPGATAGEIAELMEKKQVRRVLVTEGGKLLGLVSRADLLRALVAPKAEGGDYPDERLRRAVLAAMKREPWADSYFLTVEVKDGVVEFHGFRQSDSVLRGLKVLAEQVPGVKRVEDKTSPLPGPYYAGI